MSTPEVQKRFDELVAKRQAEILTPDEHQELLRLIDQTEKADAERVKYMAELARLRGVSLTVLMQELGIRPPAYMLNVPKDDERQARFEATLAAIRTASTSGASLPHISEADLEDLIQKARQSSHS